MINPSSFKSIDLTMSFSQGMDGYTVEIAKKIEEDGWNARNLHFYSHAGTHMDAPLHFGLKGTIDEFTPKQLMGKAWVAHIPVKEPQRLLQVDDLGLIVSKFQAGDSLLLRTGWSEFVGQEKYRSELPRIGEELAHWCVDNQVKMLGVEPPSVADVNNLQEVTSIHQILLGGNVIIIEGLTNLDKIEAEQVLLIALPLKIAGGDGSPARVIALEEN